MILNKIGSIVDSVRVRFTTIPRLSYEYMNMTYVNCGVKNYMKEDHRSYVRNFFSFFSGFLSATAKAAYITA